MTRSRMQVESQSPFRPEPIKELRPVGLDDTIGDAIREGCGRLLWESEGGDLCRLERDRFGDQQAIGQEVIAEEQLPAWVSQRYNGHCTARRAEPTPAQSRGSL